MTTATVARKRPGSSSGWARKYPPLLSLFAALLIALAVLPSSLNLPQSNPTQTLEFAPVPPEDTDDPPPPQGNLSSLGLAGSSSLQGPGAPGGDEALPGLDAPLPGVGKTPFTKECVVHHVGGETEVRQTEDPLSPPCVADFRGDNGGATYQGVSGEEVRILIYFQGFTLYVNICKDPNQSTPDKEYFDLAQPPEPDEHCVIRILRTWQQYFNDRYQTYGRFVHFFVYVSGEGRNAEERRADAAENFAKVKPFAVINMGNSFTESYLEIMARRGVLNFGSFLARSEAFFNQFPGLVWGYEPSLEKQAENFVSYLCTKVVPHKVEFSKNAGENGQERKYGLWKAADETRPELTLMAEEVERLAGEQCGLEFAATHTFPSAGFVQDNRYSGRYATTAVADFKQKGVTTIIWPGGLETNFSKQAAQLQYFPEIIVLGDSEIEMDSSAIFQEQRVWDQTHVVTTQLMVADTRQSLCYQALREADPSSDDAETRVVACEAYPHLRSLFTGIQVAGPRLTPESIDQGFHAIPPARSDDPAQPACFYDPGDYTCVKDAMVEWWDRTAEDGQGCWRAIEEGLRYFAGSWPLGNVMAQQTPEDPCNTYGSSFLIQPSPPEDPSAF